MLIACNNKKCMQHSDAKLNTTSMEVICAACNNPITNITESMKRALKSFGQTIKENAKKAFVMACKNCNANREVVMSNGGETVCKVCKGAIKVHTAMKQAIKEFGEKEEPVVAVTTLSDTTTAESPVKVKKPRQPKASVKQ